jgi:hypothetical protein
VSPALAVIGDDLRTPIAFASTGGTKTLNLSIATTQTADPVPTCLSGTAAAHTGWLSIKPRASTFLRLDAGAQTGTVLALYASVPVAGTEVACVHVGGAGGLSSSAFGHLLIPGITYIVLVGTTGNTAPSSVTLTATPVRSAWHAIYPLVNRRQGVAAASAGRRLLVFGGLQTSYAQPANPDQFHSSAVTAVDPTSGKSLTIANMPVALSYAGAAVVGSRVYLPGGRTNAAVDSSGCFTHRHLVFNLSNNTFADAPQYQGADTFDYNVVADPAHHRYFMLGGAYDPTPCDIGSGMADVISLPTVRVYDTRTRAWTNLPSMAGAREGAVAQMINGFIVVAGGLANKSPLATTEIYDPRTAKWYVGSAMPYPVWGAASGVGRTAKGAPLLYVAGGWTTTGPGQTSDTGLTQIYNIATNTWAVEKSSLLTPREAVGSATIRGKLFAVGGFSLGQPVRDVEWLRTDRQLPRITGIRITRRGVRQMRLAASATESSGVARYVWRIGKVVRTGRTVIQRFSTAGRFKGSLTVIDGAGNASSRRIAVDVR